MSYSIIIPIHNEELNLPPLLEGLKEYSYSNEILFIDDGSTDNSRKILGDCDFIKLLKLDKNSGKGVAIKKGLKSATYNKIIIADGDLELDPTEISQLMILDFDNKVDCVFGSRYKNIKPLDSLWEFGNYLFIKFFNFTFKCDLSDVLCCAKSFYKKNVDIDKITSKGFDIDVELKILLIENSNPAKTINLSYARRTHKEGKKLRLIDGWFIIRRIILLKINQILLFFKK